ncbi:helix-turn-helix domain-containing protein [Alkalihalobacterium alkalinitrilicum]|uniref:helix-turn-helix domain-containing protein n=1 Tax=Alkalihalobacterium alkalinitrilicum TaxID=427920 RepID=UPI00099577FE|nr:helix-turn-helix transcriptional regulator [Alkalihalobacterium alkalinitrilicum]
MSITNKSNKVEVKLDFELNTIMKIGHIMNWLNAENNYVLKTKEEFALEDFIKGSVHNELDRMELINEIFCELKTKPLRSPKNVKNKFKEQLKILGLKQQDLSEMTGISNSELSIVLNNKRFISMEYFLLIWISLGCPPIEKCFELEKVEKKK